jgi:hypothetical protein
MLARTLAYILAYVLACILAGIGPRILAGGATCVLPRVLTWALARAVATALAGAGVRRVLGRPVTELALLFLLRRLPGLLLGNEAGLEQLIAQRSVHAEEGRCQRRATILQLAKTACGVFRGTGASSERCLGLVAVAAMAAMKPQRKKARLAPGL